MSGISGVAEKVIDLGARAHGAASKMKAPVALDRKFQIDADKALGLATVTSIVLKDGIGCVMYVTQSLNNKRIPDEKRKFVASLDLTNGILMILAQIGMFFAMRKYSGPIFNKLFKPSFNKAMQSDAFSRIRMYIQKGDKKAQDIFGKVVPKKDPIDENYTKFKKDAASVFKFVADIAAATIIGKRVIVPLIATPLAKHVENWMDKKNGAAPKTETQKPDTKTEPNKDVTSTGAKVNVVSSQDDGDTNLLDRFKHNNNI